MNMWRRNFHGITSYERWKDIIDRVLALLALIVLGPLLALISVAIRLDSPGTPIFYQSRVGKDGKIFTIYKFRTMYVNSSHRKYEDYLREFICEGKPYLESGGNGAIYKVLNDNRVTRFGGLLRRSCLDELPQLVNVLKGEMALVGPRPEPPQAVAMYQERHKARLAVKPGITGPWQINGRYRVTFERMVQTDLDYIRRRSLWLDTKILLLTIPALISRKDGLNG